MINFEKFTLTNGLRVIVHRDTSTPIVAMNILYDVGARDEHPERTGFAHLFEHLMFGGSVNIPKYDEPLQKVGGENNAFTNNDITNYYLTFPKQNIETAFWLESDRMLSLAFSKKSLDVQRNVVSEEFKQSFLNQPYGDVWLLLKPLAYKVHPYQWNTIGKDISHIQNATMKNVKDFFKKFYCPNNAIMVIAGDVNTKEIKQLSEKWFGPIPKGPKNNRKLPVEPEQRKARRLTVTRNVPYDTIYKAYHCCAKSDKEFYATDLLSDILSNGRSSRLFRELLMKKRMFCEINAYLTGDIDKGLFIVTGDLIKGIKMEDAEKAIQEELDKIQQYIEDKELEKVKNKIESSLMFSEMNVLNKATNLAFAELMGDAGIINSEIKNYRAVTKEQIMGEAKKIFRKTNCSTLYYYAKK
ncbi:MAG TPA: pitrilysin family protein [Bacteroidales bacterium]|nr:pitrilysin family protein [Bacteroidales bacterium]HPS15624.1 pitrilysin family protein [Bacteroidales bacterium]